MDRRRFLGSSIAAAVAATVPARAEWEDVLYRPTKVESDLAAVKLDGSEFTLKQAEVQELSDSLKGKLWLPGSEAYDEARTLLEPSFDKHPAFVVQPTGPADISSAVRFARDHDLLTAVKCGGHSSSGKSSCDGGMQIDLSTYRDVYVDPIEKTARVAGGSLLGELDHEAMSHGLVTTAGTVSHTGVGGLTLGGGFGRVARRFGLTIDNALEFDIVTADGKLRRASPEQNADLFWALRGGGGNFGVVTSFKFQLHPMRRQVMNGSVIYPFAEAKQIARFFGEYAEAAPDELDTSFFMGSQPGGQPAAVVSITFSGDPGKAEALMAPMLKAGTVIQNTIAPQDYVAVQRSGDYNDIRANGAYMKTGFCGPFEGKLIDDAIDNFEVSDTRATWFGTQQSGGKIGRVSNEATAFAHREARHNLLSFVSWKMGEDPADHIKYIKAHWEHMEPHTQGFYTNDVFDETQTQVNSNYRGNFARLLKIKQEYDPTNLFRLNANIRST
ncbi:MAG: FAD-binding oxidoreductase [Woeseiaceae bacterium]|nr:FAD-binding oxidoreductase [Woeseiaceae bacterium]